MKRIFALCLWSVAVAVHGAGVVGDVEDITGSAHDQQIVFRTSAPRVNGSAYVLSIERATTSVDGSFAINLLEGTYTVTFAGRSRDTVTICVPDSSATFNFLDLICQCDPWIYRSAGKVRVSTNDLVLGYLGDKLVGGTNVSLTFTGTGADQKVTINAAGGVALSGIQAGFSGLNGKFYATNIVSTNLVTGDNDIFTVPAGMRMKVLEYILKSSASGTLSTNYTEVKIGSVYHQITAKVSQSIFNGYSVNPTLIFEPGETLALNLSTNGEWFVMSAVLFTNTLPVFSPRVLDFAAGNHVLYTAPAGKIACSAADIKFTPLWQPEILGDYINGTAATTSLLSYYLPAGFTTSNFSALVSSTTPTTAGNHAGFRGLNAMAPGDSLVISSSSTNAGQMAWVTIMELSAP